VECLEGEPEVRVGNKVAVLGLVSPDAPSLYRVEMLAVVNANALPAEKEKRPEPSIPSLTAKASGKAAALPPELRGGKATAPRARTPQADAQRREAVWNAWVARQNPKLSAAERSLIVKCVLAYAGMYGIDHRLVFAMISAESDFHPRSTSHKGAMGLTQLMPFTCKEYGITDPYDIQQNIWGGCRELGGYLRRYAGKPNYEQFALSMACYNAGSGAVRKYGGIPPYRETINYIKRVGKRFVKFHREGYP